MLAACGGFARLSADLENGPDLFGGQDGALFVGYVGGLSAGCVAVRPSQSDVCELCYLYVRLAHRGHALGRGLCEAALCEAEEMGYRWVQASVHPSSLHAIRLLFDLGFEEVDSGTQSVKFEKAIIPTIPRGIHISPPEIRYRPPSRPGSELRLVPVGEPCRSLDIFRELIQEYQKSLGVDLCFQGFEQELADPLGKYGPPRGTIFLALWDGLVAGCGALQDLGNGIAELKRIYVKPEFRRKGIARSISEELIGFAQKGGYHTVRLDTLRRLAGASELYRELGFAEIAPYNYNPEADIVYFEKPLT